MPFFTHRNATRAKAIEPTYTESPALLRELVRLYAEKLNAVTTAINASLSFGEQLPSVGALFTALSRTESRAMHELGTLLLHVRIPALPQAPFPIPVLENPMESAKHCLTLFAARYRDVAARYQRVCHLARSAKAKEVLDRLSKEATANAEALLSMHARLCRS